MMDRCDLPNADWHYTPGFLSSVDADGLLEALLALPDWAPDRIRMFGREYSTPRSIAWYGDPGATYRYSGVMHQPLAWPACIADLRERLRRETALEFNGALANYYRDGRDSMGWHSDDERGLGTRPVIASVSVGATRRFLLRHRTRRDVATVEIELGHGSLFVMRGATQKLWKHSLPKSSRCVGARVNLTFRQVLTWH